MKNFSKFKAAFAAFIFFTAAILLSCTKEDKIQPIRFIFLPNESGEARKDSRNAFKEILEEATGKPVEIITTTDYNIALEAIISGKADMAYIGAEGYITAHKRNPAVIPILTNSGPSGTLEDALYYSFIAVRTEDEDGYKTENGYDLEKLKGKIISFVSTSSTSGFVIPANILAAKFGLKNIDELIQKNDIFPKILFAGSHQGAEVNLFRKDADAAAFAIPRITGFYKLIAGEDFQTGAVYKVLEGAAEPFGEFAGQEITVIQSIPVLNAPIVINTQTLSAEEIKKIKEALASEQTANNPYIFQVPGSEKPGMYPKYSEKTKLVETDDIWYDKIRKLTE
ncbi:phosphate/phosphite/phosphonate ABC transporter substrate-binding protein [Treponema pedis]|uniref:phosphate/phosphite/phosphonate ABC transporter substrate-binding protein n=1 Tax=Treponema pedis TaxID=409322 RepID=UPI00197D24CB|nr:phosphate/phosphite/phosphonate ABC transporter substrate-binding protein [Treponema pedis]QSI05120.1 phosphate/phosphite/phosphonate ABC transporter substrate-binding protein [Treponema pedis]